MPIQLGRSFGQGLGEFIRFAEPVGYRLLHLVPVFDLNDVNDLGSRCAIDASHLGSLQRTAQEHTELEKVPFGAYEEVAGFPREHDRFMGGVDPLVSKRSSGLAQSLPRVSQILGEITCEGHLSGRPAVVLLPLFNPLLAVEALSTGHGSELGWRSRSNSSRRIARLHWHLSGSSSAVIIGLP